MKKHIQETTNQIRKSHIKTYIVLCVWVWAMGYTFSCTRIANKYVCGIEMFAKFGFAWAVDRTRTQHNGVGQIEWNGHDSCPTVNQRAVLFVHNRITTKFNIPQQWALEEFGFSFSFLFYFWWPCRGVKNTWNRFTHTHTQAHAHPSKKQKTCFGPTAQMACGVVRHASIIKL